MFAQQLTLKNANWSVEIVRSGFGACDVQRLNAFHFHGDDVVLILQTSFDQQKLVMDDNGMILLENLRCDDGVGDSGFVFKVEENETFCCSGTLARDHSSGEAHVRSMRQMLEFDGRAHASPLQFGTVVRERMRAHGHTGAAKISDQSFFNGHGSER